MLLSSLRLVHSKRDTKNTDCSPAGSPTQDGLSDGRRLLHLLSNSKQDKKTESFFQHPCVVSWINNYYWAVQHRKYVRGFKMPFIFYMTVCMSSLQVKSFLGEAKGNPPYHHYRINPTLPKNPDGFVLGFSSVLRVWKMQKKKLT